MLFFILWLLFCPSSHTIGNRSKISDGLWHTLLGKIKSTECLLCSSHSARRWRSWFLPSKLKAETFRPTRTHGVTSALTEAAQTAASSQREAPILTTAADKAPGVGAFLPGAWGCCPHPVLSLAPRARFCWGHANLTRIWSFPTLRYREAFSQNCVLPFLGRP